MGCSETVFWPCSHELPVQTNLKLAASLLCKSHGKERTKLTTFNFAYYLISVLFKYRKNLFWFYLYRRYTLTSSGTSSVHTQRVSIYVALSLAHQGIFHFNLGPNIRKWSHLQFSCVSVSFESVTSSFVKTRTKTNLFL